MNFMLFEYNINEVNILIGYIS
ncbi:hypothetical protein XBJ2_50015 [Xenorhabdus bovienii str. Jollieti]|uniref:Uncharacterized protein n=1 Tax=Xenorhabdus bovienii (strain SS-2004) TaxID=406818 RepID=D3UYA2_XENBS|nr:hypothetical protein XBJ1_0129 [Xenorhabdus bovienii SS-2004]CDH30007.1 hypothetical protein XBJ2_50015 [Xenorhabdus bovienii str. Jollieti]